MMRFLAVFVVLALCMLDVALSAPSTFAAYALGVGIPAVLAGLYTLVTK